MGLGEYKGGGGSMDYGSQEARTTLLQNRFGAELKYDCHFLPFCATTTVAAAFPIFLSARRQEVFAQHTEPAGKKAPHSHGRSFSASIWFFACATASSIELKSLDTGKPAPSAKCATM
jgi:hypothetical protein